MAKNPPTNVLKLIANATARIKKSPKQQVIPESTLSNRIRLRKEKGKGKS